MKTKYLSVFILLFSFLFCAQAQKIAENKVPQDVLISFKYKYPDAVVSYWEKTNENIYIVRFKTNEQNARAEFDKKGIWQITRFEIKEKELPTPIINYYKENYRNKDYTMSVIELHRTAQGESFYYINLKKEGFNQMKPVVLHFDLTGKLIYKDDPAQDFANEQNQQTKQTSPKEQKTTTTNNNKDTEEQENKQTNVTEEKPDDGTKYIVDPSKVPSAAKTHFASKIKKASGAVWYFYDNKYTVKFNQNGRNGSAQYTKEGVWIETRIESSEENLHQLTVNYLKENYRTYKIKSVENVTRPKDKSVLIRMYDKRSRQTPPPITEIWFTTTGKFINVDKPDVVDPYEIEQQKRKEQKDKDFMSKVDNNAVVIDNEETYYEKVSTKELPTPIHNYIKENYKDHIIKSAHMYTDDELGNCYLVKVKIEGAKYSTLLYFDIYGKFLKKEDEADRKAKNEYRPKENNNDFEEKPSKYGTPEERVSFSELPSDIPKYLKKNYPTHAVNEIYFKSDKELGNCYLLILGKTGEKKVIKLFFDLDGNLLRNEIENL